MGMKIEAIEAWTDYPIEELGDWPSRDPVLRVRKCTVLTYDGDKYCLVEVEGVRKVIKKGYIYSKPGTHEGPHKQSNPPGLGIWLADLEVDYDTWLEITENAN